MDDRHVNINDLRNNNKIADIYELILEDHVQQVKPSDYKLSDVPFVNPSEYFITSGDAVQKTKALIRDYKEVIEQLQQCILHIDVSQYLKDVQAQYTKAETLLELLLKARGTNIFLETEWNQHKLLCIPKNPRAK